MSEHLAHIRRTYDPDATHCDAAARNAAAIEVEMIAEGRRLQLLPQYRAAQEEEAIYEQLRTQPGGHELAERLRAQLHPGAARRQ